jgi:hypothetical protein
LLNYKASDVPILFMLQVGRLEGGFIQVFKGRSVGAVTTKCASRGSTNQRFLLNGRKIALKDRVTSGTLVTLCVTI